MTTSPIITVIGAGNMGSSLVGGLIRHGHPSDKLWASDKSEEKLTHLHNTFHVHTTMDNVQASQSADVIIIAIKPALFASVAAELLTLVQTRKPLIISIAAGVRELTIQHWLGGKTAIVRAMPNTPALIGCGATALYANGYVTPTQHNIAESILRAAGIVVWLENELLMDAVTALSGSGPAYFFLMMESLQEAAEQLGLPTETARLLTLQTALGAARMAIESDTPLVELRRQVTSPGGTTEKAVSVLEENNIRDLFRKALQAAKLRSEELATILGDDN
jgi:pyrroline-5-carboxylate reductase